MDHIVESRLTARESVVGAYEPSLTQVAQRYFRFAAAADAAVAGGGDSSGAGAAARQQEALRTYNELLEALSRYEFDVRAGSIVERTSVREIEAYAAAGAQAERDIEVTRHEMDALHAKLEAAHEQRRNKAECEEIAAAVNRLRPRRDLEADVREIEGRLAEINGEAALATDAVSMRQRQVRLLLASLQELTCLWEEEEVGAGNHRKGGGMAGSLLNAKCGSNKTSPQASGEDENMDEDEDDEIGGRERFEKSVRVGNISDHGENNSDVDMIEDGIEDGEIPE